MRTSLAIRAAAASAVLALFLSFGVEAPLAHWPSLVRVAGHALRHGPWPRVVVGLPKREPFLMGVARLEPGRPLRPKRPVLERRRVLRLGLLVRPLRVRGHGRRGRRRRRSRHRGRRPVVQRFSRRPERRREKKTAQENTSASVRWPAADPRSPVMPAKAGIQQAFGANSDSRVRRNDKTLPPDATPCRKAQSGDVPRTPTRPRSVDAPAKLSGRTPSSQIRKRSVGIHQTSSG